ncbi:phospholipase [Besnoitia besnoiti]|uniref:Phospholipase n=1 Tax=Besnoitia besnoiti TaxID=94643 RepID=A0A2A9MAU5_BESBE|nr:phospholipase [Besnoitia besnoiti]PFH32512.1 phospholipase [Besnoitia besnoiti]
MAPQGTTPATPAPAKSAAKREEEAAKVKEWFKNAGPVTQSEMRNADGLLLYAHHWVVSDAKAKVVLCHGYAMHSRFDYLRHDPEKLNEPPVYENSWVHKLNKAHCSVHCLDQQSFGESEGHKGKRSHVLDVEDLPRDTLQFLYEQVLPSQDPTLPIFICGVSLGGCITARVVQLLGGGGAKLSDVQAQEGDAPAKKPLPLKGAICMAPLFRMDRLKKKHKFLLPVARLLAAMAPALEVGKPARNEMYPFFHDLIETDPLCYTGKSRARLSNELLRVVDLVQDQASFLSFPDPVVKTKDSPLPYPIYVPETPSLLIVHSKNDTFVDPEGSVIVAATLDAKMHGSPETLEKYQPEYDSVVNLRKVFKHPDANLWLLDNMWHCLSKEVPEGDLLMDRIIQDWLAPRIASAEHDAKDKKEAKAEKVGEEKKKRDKKKKEEKGEEKDEPHHKKDKKRDKEEEETAPHGSEATPAAEAAPAASASEAAVLEAHEEGAPAALHTESSAAVENGESEPAAAPAEPEKPAEPQAAAVGGTGDPAPESKAATAEPQEVTPEAEQPKSSDVVEPAPEPEKSKSPEPVESAPEPEQAVSEPEKPQSPEPEAASDEPQRQETGSDVGDL